MEKQAKIDLSKSVNFVGTNDIIGGNSGSAVINRELELVGLVFDGNIEMLANKYMYRSDVPRSVSVHTAAIMESITKIYDAQWVADELCPKKKSAEQTTSPKSNGCCRGCAENTV